MKFAKELEQELVQEWKAKYFNYKLAKKKLKVVSIQANRVHQNTRRGGLATDNSSRSDLGYNFGNAPIPPRRPQEEAPVDLRSTSPALEAKARKEDIDRESVEPTEVTPILRASNARDGPVTGAVNHKRQGLKHFGSILGSPLDHGWSPSEPPELSLPDPAINPTLASSLASVLARPLGSSTRREPVITFETSLPPSPPRMSPPEPNPKKDIPTPSRTNSLPLPSKERRTLIRRLTSMGTPGQPDASKEADFRKADFEFFNFLDKELGEIGDFYKQKEDEATRRLQVLRDQLHIMREQRINEITLTRQSRIRQSRGIDACQEGLPYGSDVPNRTREPNVATDSASNARIEGPVDRLSIIKNGHIRKGSKAKLLLRNTETLRRDYISRPASAEISYSTAKRKLEKAMTEYYRGLEMLKSYSLLNRIAFQKISKKYGKLINSRAAGQYMLEKVDFAYFAVSDVVDGYIQTVEDLYARYFERGNRKIALNKLRAISRKSLEYDACVFRSTLLFTFGLAFGILGLAEAIQKLSSPMLPNLTGYLLQIYAGYGLLLLLMILFLLVCRVWSLNKINYALIFELDARRRHDWRQLMQIPCFFTFLLGFFLWMNFSSHGSKKLYLYYPVLLIVISIVTLCLPFPTLYHKSRKWFLYSHWRLFMAGLYPVEFRDFFLGDMYCSLAYSLGNVELFFCLYAGHWNNSAPNCGSSYSALLGFLQTLPGIWRAFQCIRRYHDTRSAFPHLANCGKYTTMVLYYTSLSLFRRLNKHVAVAKALFMTFAITNAVYSSIWDVIIDWSLGNPHARHPFLRDDLGYKYVWTYYIAIVLDPILRCNWVFYVIYTKDVHHAAATSFFVGLSEILRRSMWMLFRVENEHCTNVGLFRASRDVALPYEIPTESTVTDMPLSSEETVVGSSRTLSGSRPSLNERSMNSSRTDSAETYPDLEAARTYEDAATAGKASTPRENMCRPTLTRGARYSSNTPIMKGLNRMGSHLYNAHAQDFQRKGKNPAEETNDDDESDEGESSEDEDYEGDEEEMNSHVEHIKKYYQREREVEEGGGAEPNQSSWNGKGMGPK